MPPRKNNRLGTPKPPPSADRAIEVQAPADPTKPESVIAVALWGVMMAVGYVEHTAENDFHKYTYATERDVLNALRPELLKQGLFMIPSLVQANPIDEHGNVFAVWEYTLAHKSGAIWPEKIRAGGAGNDKARNGSVGDKGFYKAFTGANKYLLFKLFQIATGQDPEKDDHAHRTAEQQQRQQQGGNRQQQGGDQQRKEEPAKEPYRATQEEEAKFIDQMRGRLDKAKTDTAVQKLMMSPQVVTVLATLSVGGAERVRAAAIEKYQLLKKGNRGRLKDPDEPKPEDKAPPPDDDPQQDRIPD